LGHKESLSGKDGTPNISKETLCAIEGRCEETKEVSTTNVEYRYDEEVQKTTVLAQIVLLSYSGI
jgi:hypothetical protein